MSLEVFASVWMQLKKDLVTNHGGKVYTIDVQGFLQYTQEALQSRAIFIITIRSCLLFWQWETYSICWYCENTLYSTKFSSKNHTIGLQKDCRYFQLVILLAIISLMNSAEDFLISGGQESSSTPSHGILYQEHFAQMWVGNSIDAVGYWSLVPETQ